MNFSPESLMPTEPLRQNQQRMDSYFGDFFGLMRKALVAGGVGTGLRYDSLFPSSEHSRQPHY